MKSLITAFALLSFVAASTVPMIAQAQAAQSETKHKTTQHKPKKNTHHASHAKKTKTSNKKMKKPSQA